MKEKKIEYCIIEGLPFSVRVLKSNDIILTNELEKKSYKMYSSMDKFKCI